MSPRPPTKPATPRGLSGSRLIMLGAEMPKLPLKATIFPFTEATCAAVEELRPEVVSFHFGFRTQRPSRA